MKDEPAEDALEALTQFLYQAPIGLVRTTLDGDILMINPMSAQLLLPLASTSDVGLTNLFDALNCLAPGLRALAGATTPGVGFVICEAMRLVVPPHLRRAGAPTTLSLKLVQLDRTTLMATLTDASADAKREQQELAAQLHLATHTDKLTSMPNPLAVVAHLESELGRMHDIKGYRFAILLINADRFQRINLTLGQATGDAVLRTLAARLQSMANGSLDDAKTGPRPLAARLEGDEFVLVVPCAHCVADLPALAERLTQTLCKPYSVAGAEIHLSVSVGWAVTGEATSNAQELLQSVKLAMRDAKRHGGARHRQFEPSLQNAARYRAVVEAELRTALVSGELFVVYQPIVDLRTDKVTGTEALVRWQHPHRGLVSPVEFIEIAEQTGLIGQLGAWVLEQACCQLASWQSTIGAAAPQIVSVNLSRAQLDDPAIADVVLQALTVSGLPPASLQLEVTESLAVLDKRMQLRLGELKALGLTLALDDFGTGYSSLSTLHLLPVDVIKIDRSFVSQAETSTHHRVLIEAVSKIALSLNMSTVAEGIEDEAQARILASLSCDKGQGYWYSRPMTAAATTAWLIKRAEVGVSQRQRTPDTLKMS